MPIAYRYFELDREFPRTDRPITPGSQAALGDMDHEPTTLAVPNGHIQGAQFSKWDVEHQFRRDITAIVRREYIDSLVQIVRFSMYVDDGDEYLLTSGAEGKIAKAAMRRLREADPAVRTSVPEIDLGKLLILGDVTGGWFGNLQITDVDSAALFGSSHVVASSEWQRYARLGALSSIVMRVVDPNGDEQAVQLTHERLVLLYREQPEPDALHFVRDIQHSIDSVLSAIAAS